MKSLTLTIVLCCLIVLFIITLVKNNLLKDILKFYKDFPLFAKIVLYVLVVIACLLIIILELKLYGIYILPI